MAVAFGKSMNDVKDAIEFNKVVNQAIINCKCIVSDEKWPHCNKNFCTSPDDSSKIIARTRRLLHGNSTLCKNWISKEEQLSCYFESTQITNLTWTEWSPPNADKIKYRIKEIPPYGIYYVPSFSSIVQNSTG
uniref:Uncharacterized protein n=1 Tax=Panagrolaimus davidi TaxID=227884 RepID=A0A914PWB9_9BILA